MGFPKGLRPIAERIKVRDIAVFHGAVDLEKLNPLERWMFKNVEFADRRFPRLGRHHSLGSGDRNCVEGETASVKAIVV